MNSPVAKVHKLVVDVFNINLFPVDDRVSIDTVDDIVVQFVQSL